MIVAPISVLLPFSMSTSRIRTQQKREITTTTAGSISVFEYDTTDIMILYKIEVIGQSDTDFKYESLTAIAQNGNLLFSNKDTEAPSGLPGGCSILIDGSLAKVIITGAESTEISWVVFIEILSSESIS
jgi:hypothetical protein